MNEIGLITGIPDGSAIIKVQAGTYKPDLGKQHSHVGSIGNLCLDKIRDKYDM